MPLSYATIIDGAAAGYLVRRSSQTRDLLTNVALTRSKWLIVIWVTLLMLPLVSHVLNVGGGLWYAFVWAKQFTAELAHNVSPRWLSASYGGHGAPVFYFYA